MGYKGVKEGLWLAENPLNMDPLAIAMEVSMAGYFADAGDRLKAETGDAGFVQAAAIAAIFNGLVRTADSTGIPLDENMRDAAEQVRATLGIKTLPGHKIRLGSGVHWLSLDTQELVREGLWH